MSRHDNAVLDDHFEDILTKIKPYLLRLPVGPESHLCQLWLERLDVAHDQRYLRNDYLMELYKQLKNCQLKAPFNKLPDDSRLIPLAKHHRLLSTSSCNEMTDASPKLVVRRRSRNKIRSKSVHPPKDGRPVEPMTSSCPEHERCMSTGFHFASEEQRSPKSLLKTYKGKIETLSAVIHELEIENEGLRQKLYHINNTNGSSEEVPRSKVKQLLAEIANLKSKLDETNQIKAVLMKNHNDVVNQYKTKLTEQFNKMKYQLETSRTENQELTDKIAMIEQKFQELNTKKEDAVKENNVNWEQKIDGIKSKLETLLKGKEVELKLKDSIIQEKDKEIALKKETIENLQKKVEVLKQSVETKNQDDGKLQFMLLEQYKSMKNELKKMKNEIEEVSHQQTESRVAEVTNIKKKMRKLEKYIFNFQQKYDSEISHLQQEKKKKANCSDACILKKNYSLNEKIIDVTSFNDDKISITNFDEEYQTILSHIESSAGKHRNKYEKRMSFIRQQIARLKEK